MLMQAAKRTLRIDESMKSLFKSNTARHFSMGFVLGAVLVMAAVDFDGEQDLVAPALAATAPE